MKRQIIKCGDEEVMYFLNNGWEIVAQAQNPYPQPYIYFFVAKELPEFLEKVEIVELLTEARSFIKFTY